MTNSKLRNCFFLNIRNLKRCIKWGFVGVGLTISITQAKRRLSHKHR